MPVVKSKTLTQKEHMKQIKENQDAQHESAVAQFKWNARLKAVDVAGRNNYGGNQTAFMKQTEEIFQWLIKDLS